MIDRSPSRLVFASGAAFAVLALAAFLLALGPDETDARSILAYYIENSTAVEWQAVLYGLAAVLFLWFIGSVARAIRSDDRTSAHAPVALVAGAVTVGLYTIGIGGWLTLASQFEGAPGVEGADGFAFGDASLLWNLSSAAFALSNFPAATFVLALAFGLLERRLTPEWISWAGVALAAALLLQGALQIVGDGDAVDVLGIIAFLAFLAWVFALSIALVRTPSSA